MIKKSNKDIGSYLYRNGKKIKVTKEEDIFTARIKEKDDIQRLNTLPGVNKVELLNNGIYKVSVDPITRDTAMDTFRSETVIRRTFSKMTFFLYLAKFYMDSYCLDKCYSISNFDMDINKNKLINSIHLSEQPQLYLLILIPV
jgi:hypothetical protein